MAKKYTIKTNRIGLYDDLIHSSPLLAKSTDFDIQFLNGSLDIGNNKDHAKVFRDLKMENPNGTAIPFEEHIYHIKDGRPKKVGEERNFPDYIPDEIKKLYEQKIYGGAPHWMTVRANRILPDNFREAVDTLIFPQWCVQEAKVISMPDYRLRFGLNQGGIKAVCFNDDNTLGNWLKTLANEYNAKLVEEIIKSSIVNLPDNTKFIQLIPGYTYAQGVQALKEAYEREEHLLDRPLTFGENLLAKLENPRLFNNILNSCTGFARKRGTSLIKIIQKCDELINIPLDFNNNRITNFNYDLLDGKEFDLDQVVYNNPFTNARDAINDPLWQAAVNDQEILEKYAKFYFERLKRKSGMEFSLWHTKKDKDILNMLCIHNIINNSRAGIRGLNYDNAYFARAIAPSGEL